VTSVEGKGPACSSGDGTTPRETRRLRTGGQRTRRRVATTDAERSLSTGLNGASHTSKQWPPGVPTSPGCRSHPIGVRSARRPESIHSDIPPEDTCRRSLVDRTALMAGAGSPAAGGTPVSGPPLQDGAGRVRKPPPAIPGERPRPGAVWRAGLAAPRLASLLIRPGGVSRTTVKGRSARVDPCSVDGRRGPSS
jgi:hypothetical protein